MGHHNGKPRRARVWIVGKLDLPQSGTGWRLHLHADRGQRQHAHRNCDGPCGPHADDLADDHTHTHADSHTYTYAASPNSDTYSDAHPVTTDFHGAARLLAGRI
jgi:hypothetical protein